ncbi:hypothetical protein GGI20_001814 [Coemansia sp. BCRC 34301]|nr:hypothetical protein GGI20_001814 [Coemansia sp. BCRC 34301]
MSPPGPDFTYYLQQLLQIPEMLGHEEERQQHQYSTASSSLQEMTSVMSGKHGWGYKERVTFAQPIATMAEVGPMSSVDPVGLLSCRPYRSCLRVGLNAQQQQQQLAYLAEYDEYRRYHHHHEYCGDYSGENDYCDHYSHSQYTGNSHSNSCGSQYYEHTAGGRRRKSADYGIHNAVNDDRAKQYRYDDRFSLSMEHLPLYNQL